MSLYPQTGQKAVSPQPPSPTPGKKSPLFPSLRRFSKARSLHRKVRDSVVVPVEQVASSCSSSASASERSSLSSDIDHEHVSGALSKGGEPHSPLRSGISPQTQASMDNVFRCREGDRQRENKKERERERERERREEKRREYTLLLLFIRVVWLLLMQV